MAWFMKLPISVLFTLGVMTWVVSVNLLKADFDPDQPMANANVTPHAGPPALAPLPNWANELPDFSEFAAGSERKQAFFNYLVPIIHHINSQILLDRYQLMGLVDSLKHKRLLSSKQQRQLAKLIKKYRVEDSELKQQINRLLLRVDVVPASLALAQAANESAWGTSRFAIEANNLFGQWCYREGCGIVPSARPEDENHEVRAFASPVESVTSYMRNLNTHQAYLALRQLRRSVRINDQGVTGLHIVQGLESYSSRGQDYVDELSAMIRFNDLQQYDEY